MTKLRPIFLSMVRSEVDCRAAHLLVESLREFGGPLRDAEVWVFAPRALGRAARVVEACRATVLPIEPPRSFHRWPYADKVAACAEAERLAGTDCSSLVWIDTECLIVQPPDCFDLGTGYDAAVRPVHIRNVGLAHNSPLDSFWGGIQRAIGVRDHHRSVQTFVTGETIRAYYNSHGFAVRPELGLFGRWRAIYERLISDEGFVSTACVDAPHRLFLFQALLSSLIGAEIAEDRLRVLPWTYNYPYNLHGRVPPSRRPASLNDVVCFTFEGRSIRPDEVRDTEIREPLRSWLNDCLRRYPPA